MIISIVLGSTYRITCCRSRIILSQEWKSWRERNSREWRRASAISCSASMGKVTSLFRALRITKLLDSNSWQVSSGLHQDRRERPVKQTAYRLLAKSDERSNWSSETFGLESQMWYTKDRRADIISLIIRNCDGSIYAELGHFRRIDFLVSQRFLFCTFVLFDIWLPSFSCNCRFANLV